MKRKLNNQHCRLFKTPWSISGWNDNEIKYLSKHYVKCPNGYGLKYFRLFTNSTRNKF